MVTAYDAQTNDRLLFDFGSSGKAGQWIIINDDVMGGQSSSEMILTDEGTALFHGTLSLDNDGGFASVRTAHRAYDLSDYQGLVLRMRGDGRRYRLRLYTGHRIIGAAYEAEFDTVLDRWITVYIPFQEAVPALGERTLQGLPKLSGANVRQIGLMIADKQAGPFRLEVAWIQAYRPRF